MKKFIVRTILFAISIWLLLSVLDRTITSGLRKTEISNYQVWNDIYASKIRSDVIIMGSSRAWEQYNPRILDSIVGLNFYNLGFNGQWIDYQINRYNAYRRHNPKPKFIIQNIDFLSLRITNSVYAKEQFFPYIFDDSLISVVEKVQRISWLDKNIPFIRYFGYHYIIQDGILSFFGKKDLAGGGLYKGFRGEALQYDGSELSRIDTLFCERESAAIKMFDEYLYKCKFDGIKVILVSAPIYSAAKKKILNLSGFNALVADIARKHNLLILDYLNDPISNDSTFFYDSTHLNKKGAEIFSAKLANDIKRKALFK
jgi:hypothetical protein